MREPALRLKPRGNHVQRIRSEEGIEDRNKHEYEDNQSCDDIDLIPLFHASLNTLKIHKGIGSFHRMICH